MSENRGSPSQTEIIKNIRELAREFKYKDILDVGCGAGLYTNLFCVNNNNVTGLDLQEVVDQTKIRFRFVKGDALKMPFIDSSFDAVVSFDVIEHLSDDRLFLRECYRVLKKGGRLIIGTPNRHRVSFFLLSFLGQKPKFPRNLGKDHVLGDIIHLREYTLKELGGLLNESGFKPREIRLIWLGLSLFKGVEIGLKKPPPFLSRFAQYILFSSQK
ncbi:class I SAM-dependent methyltransferase [Candidatus Gottesmanbacteria bacterium]|nr:class I SAM-dependent methyltransferase [Candidatus Gottesmanbacteria bacterium]